VSSIPEANYNDDSPARTSRWTARLGRELGVEPAVVVVTGILHVIGLALINERLVQVKRIAAKGFDSILVFALVMGITTLLVTLLHAG
jgi:hypothetical protein